LQSHKLLQLPILSVMYLSAHFLQFLLFLQRLSVLVSLFDISSAGLDESSLFSAPQQRSCGAQLGNMNKSFLKSVFGGGMATFIVVATSLFALSAAPVFATVTEVPIVVTDPVSGAFYLDGTTGTSGSYWWDSFSGSYPATSTSLVGGTCSGGSCSWDNALRLSGATLSAQFGSTDGDYWWEVYTPSCTTDPACTSTYFSRATLLGGRWYAYDSVSTSTRIVSVTYPISGSVSTSTTIYFRFKFYNNTSDDDPITSSGVEVNNLTTGTQFAPPLTDSLSSGLNTNNSIITLPSGSAYMWRPYITSTSTGRIIYGDWVGYRYNSS